MVTDMLLYRLLLSSMRTHNWSALFKAELAWDINFHENKVCYSIALAFSQVSHNHKRQIMPL
jgi:hypothetical protein